MKYCLDGGVDLFVHIVALKLPVGGEDERSQRAKPQSSQAGPQPDPVLDHKATYRSLTCITSNLHTQPRTLQQTLLLLTVRSLTQICHHVRSRESALQFEGTSLSLGGVLFPSYHPAIATKASADTAGHQLIPSHSSQRSNSTDKQPKPAKTKGEDTQGG